MYKLFFNRIKMTLASYKTAWILAHMQNANFRSRDVKINYLFRHVQIYETMLSICSLQYQPQGIHSFEYFTSSKEDFN